MPSHTVTQQQFIDSYAKLIREMYPQSPLCNAFVNPQITCDEANEFLKSTIASYQKNLTADSAEKVRLALLIAYYRVKFHRQDVQTYDEVKVVHAGLKFEKLELRVDTSLAYAKKLAGNFVAVAASLPEMVRKIDEAHKRFILHECARQFMTREQVEASFHREIEPVARALMAAVGKHFSTYAKKIVQKDPKAELSTDVLKTVVDAYVKLAELSLPKDSVDLVKRWQKAQYHNLGIETNTNVDWKKSSTQVSATRSELTIRLAKKRDQYYRPSSQVPSGQSLWRERGDVQKGDPKTSPWNMRAYGQGDSSTTSPDTSATIYPIANTQSEVLRRIPRPS